MVIRLLLLCLVAAPSTASTTEPSFEIQDPYVCVGPYCMCEHSTVNCERLSRELTEEALQSLREKHLAPLPDRLIFSGNHVNTVSNGSFDNPSLAGLEVVDLSDNTIDMIEIGALRGLPKLRRLDLQKNRLRDIHPDVLENNPLLNYVNLHKNKLTHLDDNNFLRRAASLSAVILSENEIRTLGDRTFYDLEHLVSIDLHGNQLFSLPKVVFQFRHNLSFVNLGNNSFTSVSLLPTVTHIEQVHIADNRIALLPNMSFPSAGYLNIEILVLKNNFITEIESDAFRGLHSLKFLDLSYNKLLEVNGDIFRPCSTIRTLFLGNNRLHTFDGFMYMGFLTFLDLSNNRISNLTNESFVSQEASKLTSLHLEQNFIIFMEEEAFSKLPNLEYLYLGHNIIEYIPPTLFDSNPKLGSVDLTGNRMFHADIFFQFPHIKHITLAQNLLENLYGGESTTEALYADFSFNKIHKIEPHALKGYIHIQRLNLAENGIFDVNSTVFSDVYELSELYINGNNITELNFLGNVTSLTFLDASQNNIHQIRNETFSDTPELTFLDLSFNHIRKIELGTFSKTRHLKRLELANNLITELPQDILKDTNNLEYIDLSRNQIKNVNFLKSKSLHLCALFYNKISKIDADSFVHVEQLSHLDLGDNEISFIHPEAFTCLRNLQYLNLEGNRIKDLPNGIISHLINLRNLNIARNEITNITEFTFAGTLTNALEELDLSSNRISSINYKAFRYLVELKHLNLSFNNIDYIHTYTFYWNKNLRSFDLSENGPGMIINLQFLSPVLAYAALSDIIIKLFSTPSSQL